MNKSENKVFYSEVLEILDSGDAVLELPEGFVNCVGWKIGDEIQVFSKDGEIILKKK